MAGTVASAPSTPPSGGSVHIDERISDESLLSTAPWIMGSLMEFVEIEMRDMEDSAMDTRPCVSMYPKTYTSTTVPVFIERVQTGVPRGVYHYRQKQHINNNNSSSTTTTKTTTTTTTTTSMVSSSAGTMMMPPPPPRPPPYKSPLHRSMSPHSTPPHQSPRLRTYESSTTPPPSPAPPAPLPTPMVFMPHSPLVSTVDSRASPSWQEHNDITI